jgi:predicted alpha/beta superfamily hydrolase
MDDEPNRFTSTRFALRAQRYIGFCVFSLLLSLSLRARAELLPARNNIVKSTVLREERAIAVYLPEEAAKNPAQRFEAVYVLDGDWNATIVTNIVNFMRQVAMMPPVIVVSVPNYIDAQGNNTRERDFIPRASSAAVQPDGAAAFLKFIRTELVPYVDRNYPTNGTNLIHGHSFGGLFLMYVLANDPQLFDGYLALDPALGWDNGSMNTVLSGKIAGWPTTGKAIFIAGRSGAGFKEMALDQTERALRSNAKPALHWRLISYDDESHDSLKLKGTYDGLKYAYGGYTQDPLEIHPTDGVMIKGRPFRVVTTVTTNGRLHINYTTDGSEPTETSRQDDGTGIMVGDPRQMRLELLSLRGQFNQAVPLHLKFGQAFLPGTSEPSQTMDTGWHYTIYRSVAQPKVDETAALATGTVPQELSLSSFSVPRVAGHVYRRLDVLEEGYFVFVVKADEAQLHLGVANLITAKGDRGRRTQSYLAPLRRGSYALSLDFVESTKDAQLHLAVIQCKDGLPIWWDQQPWLSLDIH